MDQPNESSASVPLRTPQVKWAQRDDVVYLTICVPLPKVDLVMIDDEDFRTLYFRGRDPSNNIYEVEFELYGRVYDEFRQAPHDRGVELILLKKKASWWSRLLRAGGRAPWFVGVDFGKWKDEDKSKKREYWERKLGYKKDKINFDAIFHPPVSDPEEFDEQSEEFDQLVQKKRNELKERRNALKGADERKQ